MRVRLLLTMLGAVGVVVGGVLAFTVRAAASAPAVTTVPAVESPSHAASCLEAYWSAASPSGYYFPAGANVEVLDDLHLGPTSVASLCAVDVGYFKSDPGPTNAAVAVYGGSPGDDPPGAPLATFAVPALAGGENFIHLEMPAAALPQDVWLGVSFSTAGTGLLLADPPTGGASDDIFYMRPAATDYYTFGGNPRANFLLDVYATAGVVAVEPGSGLPARSGFATLPGPNPTRAELSIRFAVRDAGPVRVEVLDVAGRVVALVANRNYRPGFYGVEWDGRTTHGDRAAAGVYLLRLTMPGFAGSRKVVLLR